MMKLEVTIEGITTVYTVGEREEMRYARHLWRTCKPETMISVFDWDGKFLETLRLDELFQKPVNI